MLLNTPGMFAAVLLWSNIGFSHLYELVRTAKITSRRPRLRCANSRSTSRLVLYNFSRYPSDILPHHSPGVLSQQEKNNKECPKKRICSKEAILKCYLCSFFFQYPLTFFLQNIKHYTNYYTSNVSKID